MNILTHIKSKTSWEGTVKRSNSGVDTFTITEKIEVDVFKNGVGYTVDSKPIKITKHGTGNMYQTILDFEYLDEE
jgi:hypothetical protein